MQVQHVMVRHAMGNYVGTRLEGKSFGIKKPNINIVWFNFPTEGSHTVSFCYLKSYYPVNLFNYHLLELLHANPLGTIVTKLRERIPLHATLPYPYSSNDEFL